MIVLHMMKTKYDIELSDNSDRLEGERYGLKREVID